MLRLIRQIIRDETVIQIVMCGLNDYEVRIINKMLRDLISVVNFRNLREAKEYVKEHEHA